MSSRVTTKKNAPKTEATEAAAGRTQIQHSNRSQNTSNRALKELQTLCRRRPRLGEASTYQSKRCQSLQLPALGIAVHWCDEYDEPRTALATPRDSACTRTTQGLKVPSGFVCLFPDRAHARKDLSKLARAVHVAGES